MSGNDSATASVTSDEHVDARPNRWAGDPSTWQKHTAHERKLAASLDQIRNLDLSLHLYNAHALKLRAKEHRVNPGTARVNTEYPMLLDTERTFKPPKSWTAWPLQPEDMPRKPEEGALDDIWEGSTVKRFEAPWPSKELEDICVGVISKLAKERFKTREPQGCKETEAQPIYMSEYDHGEYETIGKASMEASSSLKEEAEHEILLKPIVSLDDDFSHKLLRPSIRHTFVQLDALLVALHHTRGSCSRYTQSDHRNTDDDDDVVSNRADDDEQAEGIQRLKGRPRKFANLPDRSRNIASMPIPTFDHEHLRIKKTHRGRPLKAYERLEGENELEFATRIARLQKKPLPSFAPPQSSDHSQSPTKRRTSRSRSPWTKRASDQNRAVRQKRLGLRDWSEVLGAAALVGFAPDVITRATQRCANLFGEGMAMRKLIEMPSSEKESDILVRYAPDFVDFFNVVTTTDEESASSSADESVSIQSKPQFEMLTRNFYFCPMSGCQRRLHGFRSSPSLKCHLQNWHEIFVSDVEDYILPSDEELDGAIHVDGFLRSVKSMPFRERKRRGNIKIDQSRRKTLGQEIPPDNSREKRRTDLSKTSGLVNA